MGWRGPVLVFAAVMRPTYPYHGRVVAEAGLLAQLVIVSLRSVEGSPSQTAAMSHSVSCRRTVTV